MAPEKPTSAPKQSSSPETPSSIVSQPQKLTTIDDRMSEQLGSFLDQVEEISEASKKGPGEQWSGSSTSTSAIVKKQGSSGASARDEAIAAIPVAAVMQKELKKHIQAEVKKLRKQAKEISRVNQPGKAYKLNQVYARIRHLNSLLGEMLHSSYEVVKRLFIKVFIDRQPIL